MPGISRRPVTIFLALFACLLLAVTAHAQTETTGAVEGEVRDPQNNPVPGAVVLLINQETQVQTAAKADASGRFVKFQLQPGAYTVRVSVPGFKPFEKTQGVFITRTLQVLPPIRLENEVVAVASPTPDTTPQPGATVPPTLPPTTTPASGAQTGIQVEDRAEDVVPDVSPLSATDGRRAGSYPEKEVVTLPLGSSSRTRTFDELALLLPGVAPPPLTLGDIAGPGVGAGVGSAGQFSVNGMRSRANNFTVDGSDNNDEDIGVRRQGFLALVPQPIESIREYQVISLLAPAQYGRNFGAQVNAVSKSGGNETHGTFFGFLNTSQLNARNVFDTANGTGTFALRSDQESGRRPVLLGGRPLTVTNQSGGEDSFTLGQGGFVLGGPLEPDRGPGKSRRMFYFVSAEGHILNANKEASFAVPTVDQRGFLNTGATGFTLFDEDDNELPVFPTRLAGDAIFSLFPFPNNPAGVYGRNTFTQILPAGGQSKIASGKFDANFRISGRQQFFTARYNFTDDWRDIPVTGGAIFSTLRPRVRTQNFSTFLNSELSAPDSPRPIFNQLRLSYGRTRLVFDENRNPLLLPSSFSPDTPFLLNRPFIFNNTLPGGSGDCPAGSVCYETADILRSPGGTIIGGTTETGFNVFGGTDDGGIGPVGQVIISGFSPLGVDVFNFPQSRVNNTYQLADTANTRIGNHSIAFGADLRRVELISSLPRNARPLITFGGTLQLPGSDFPALSPIDFASAGAPTGLSVALARGDSGIHLRYYQLYFFGQDEWRVTPNLSLSYGLRYEYNTVPGETDNRIERSFNAPELSLLPDLRTFIAGRTEIYDSDRNNFAPRVGFAYSNNFFGDKTTVIRGGYGLFYDQIIGSVVSQSRNVYPTFLTLNTAGGILSGGDVRDFILFNPTSALVVDGIPVCNASVRGQDGTFNCYVVAGTVNTLNAPLRDVVEVNRDNRVGGFGITLPARNLETPMAHHYSVTFEQELTNNMVASAAYVGTLGRNLLRLATPNLGPNVILNPVGFEVVGNEPVLFGTVIAPGNAARRRAPTAGAVNIYESAGDSRYDALQLQLRGRYVNRLQYQAHYTFSHSEDDVSDVFDLAGAAALPQNSLTRAGERADSNFDARHRVAYNLIYTLPQFADRGRAFRSIFGGLELASTGQFQTGQPFTVNSIFDVNLDGNLTDRLNSDIGIIRTGDRDRPLALRPGTNPISLLAPVGRDGSIPRNSFRASNLLLFNVAVIKHFRLAETTGLTFRTEVFNLTDRDNFGIPVRFLEAPGFGQATDTVTPGRRVQFALKLSF